MALSPLRSRDAAGASGDWDRYACLRIYTDSPGSAVSVRRGVTEATSCIDHRTKIVGATVINGHWIHLRLFNINN